MTIEQDRGRPTYFPMTSDPPHLFVLAAPGELVDAR
jgi:hypothetical protein